MNKESADIYNLVSAAFRKEPDTLFEAKVGTPAVALPAPVAATATSIMAIAATTTATTVATTAATMAATTTATTAATTATVTDPAITPCDSGADEPMPDDMLFRIHSYRAVATDQELKGMIFELNKNYNAYYSKNSHAQRRIKLISAFDYRESRVMADLVLDAPDNGRPVAFEKGWYRIRCFDATGARLPVLKHPVDSSLPTVARLVRAAVDHAMMRRAAMLREANHAMTLRAPGFFTVGMTNTSHISIK